MKPVVSYLTDPNKFGVHLTTVSIDLTDLKKLLQEIRLYDEKHQIKSTERYKLLTIHSLKYLSNNDVAEYAVEDLINAVSRLHTFDPSEHMKKGIPLGKISVPHNIIVPMDLGLFRKYLLTDVDIPSNFLKPNIALLSTMDAINIKHSFDFNSQKLTLDVLSVKEGGSHIFEEFIKTIPIIGKKVNIVQRGRKYSSRYCLNHILPR